MSEVVVIESGMTISNLLEAAKALAELSNRIAFDSSTDLSSQLAVLASVDLQGGGETFKDYNTEKF